GGTYVRGLEVSTIAGSISWRSSTSSSSGSPAWVKVPCSKRNPAMSGVPAAEKMVFMMISNGTANKAPVVPHTQAQNESEIRIDKGLIVSRWPTTIGVKKFASIRWKLMKAAGG